MFPSETWDNDNTNKIKNNWEYFNTCCVPGTVWNTLLILRRWDIIASCEAKVADFQDSKGWLWYCYFELSNSDDIHFTKFDIISQLLFIKSVEKMIANDLPCSTSKQRCQLVIVRVTINYTPKGTERRQKIDNNVSAGCESVLAWERHPEETLV